MISGVQVPGRRSLPMYLFRWQPKSAFKKLRSFQHVELQVFSAHSLCKQIVHLEIWVCLKIGYIPNYSHLVGIMIINHWL